MDPRFNNSSGGVQPPGPPEVSPGKYQFSADELRVLRECEVESFYQRSLPIGTGLSLAAWYCVKQGYVKGSVKYGPIPKVALGAILGYFIGKFSYQNKCAEKIMRLPNSQLGEMLRKRRKGGFTEGFSMDPSGAFGMAPNANQDPASDKSLQQNSSLDLDFSRPSSSGLDDTYRPNLDTPISKFDDDLPLDPPKTATSYDELRRVHRDEWQKRNSAPQTNPALLRRAPPPPAEENAQQPPQSYPNPPANRYPAAERVDPVQKNKYGDVWT